MMYVVGDKNNVTFKFIMKLKILYKWYSGIFVGLVITDPGQASAWV